MNKRTSAKVLITALVIFLITPFYLSKSIKKVNANTKPTITVSGTYSFDIENESNNIPKLYYNQQYKITINISEYSTGTITLKFADKSTNSTYTSIQNCAKLINGATATYNFTNNNEEIILTVNNNKYIEVILTNTGITTQQRYPLWLISYENNLTISTNETLNSLKTIEEYIKIIGVGGISLEENTNIAWVRTTSNLNMPKANTIYPCTNWAIGNQIGNGIKIENNKVVINKDGIIRIDYKYMGQISNGANTNDRVLYVDITNNGINIGGAGTATSGLNTLNAYGQLITEVKQGDIINLQGRWTTVYQNGQYNNCLANTSMIITYVDSEEFINNDSKSKLDLIIENQIEINSEIITKLDMIYNQLIGDETINNTIDNNTNQNNQLNEQINEYEEINSTFESNFNDSLQSINLDDLSNQLNSLTQSTTWWRTQMDNIYNSMGNFRFVLLLPLVVGIALILIGR